MKYIYKYLKQKWLRKKIVCFFITSETFQTSLLNHNISFLLHLVVIRRVERTNLSKVIQPQNKSYCFRFSVHLIWVSCLQSRIFIRFWNLAGHRRQREYFTTNDFRIKLCKNVLFVSESSKAYLKYWISIYHKKWSNKCNQERKNILKMVLVAKIILCEETKFTFQLIYFIYQNVFAFQPKYIHRLFIFVVPFTIHFEYFKVKKKNSHRHLRYPFPYTIDPRAVQSNFKKCGFVK